MAFLNAKEPVDYVNPNMGGISHTLKPTHPTVQLPNSMLRVFPRRAEFNDAQIDALPLAVCAHRSAGQIALEVFSGEAGGLSERAYPRKYFYDAETITPYSYEVFLEGENVAVKFAPSSKSAIYSFDFSEAKDAARNIKIRVPNGSARAFENGISAEENLPNGAKIRIYMAFSKTPSRVEISKSGKSATAVFENCERQIFAKYAVSYISFERAKSTLEREIADFDLEGLAARGRKIWNEKLSKIKVEGSEDDKAVFYTSLWRVYERMVDASEYGAHYNPSSASAENSDAPFYVDDWIWDTYRTSHPLRILIDAELERDMLNSYIALADSSPEKWMPTFPQIFGDAHAMNGNHAAIAFADAAAKNLGGVDYKKAALLIKNTLETATLTPWSRSPRNELDEFYDEFGYFPALAYGEGESAAAVNKFERRQSVAVTLAAAYDDLCLSRLLRKIGDAPAAEKFERRAQNYKNLFNPETKFFHPKDRSGEFIQPLDYRFAGGLGFRDFYDENNAYTYRFDTAGDPENLVRLFGGKKELSRALDGLLTTPLGKPKREFYAENGPDQTGNIGQLAIGNEPSFHIPYLYNYAGEPHKTQKLTRQILKTWFRNDLMGVPGDEDGGAMSAFVVFTQLGFYPIAPGIAAYEITSPVFTESQIALSNGKTFKISARNNSEKNKYISSAKLNGKELKSPRLTHEQIMSGGELVLEMSARPSGALKE